MKVVCCFARPTDPQFALPELADPVADPLAAIRPFPFGVEFMTLAWNLFTPWSALVGGLTIGLATALYVLGNGRVAGIAGIVASPLRALLSGKSLVPERTRLLFIAGLMLAPALWGLFAPFPIATLDVGNVAVAAAGVFVGVGVRMGNGCTSGHGVCGLSRLSLRSLANVLAFMGAGVATVFVLRHLF
jgi:uncharacterized protein